MGVIKHFSADSRDNCGKYYTGSEWRPIASTPDPTNFKIKEKFIINGYPIFWVQYPGVENYEGNKILMYKKNFDLSKIKDRMDPHFFEAGDSPIARFEPTQYGLEIAIKLAKELR